MSLDARDVSDAGGASDAKEARDDAGEASFADAGGADDGAAGIEGAPSATAASASPALGAAPALLPSYETAAGNDSSLPALTLEFHAFADDPARRFVYINGEKYVEGATLKEGPKVVRITADGVVLDVSGRQFLLGRK
ncbi:MAG TPA: general secretion pathway protein GspB [Gammaproteobacteria bacterium]|nr:general secretion pathway protein GspB [Gammaproteobacteria bacterium]